MLFDGDLRWTRGRITSSIVIFLTISKFDASKLMPSLSQLAITEIFVLPVMQYLFILESLKMIGTTAVKY